jgi:outer membrane receptor protein involved in Fe transport
VVVRRANPDEAKALLGDVLDLAAVSKKAAAAADPAAAVDAAVTAIDAAGTKAEIPASVDAFIRSRIREIAIEVPELS